MIQNFKNKFGSPDKTVVIYRNYSKDNNMKGLESTINKKFRRIFRNAGYETYLINEFRTSKLCNCCHNELEKFMERPSKKPKSLDKVYFCHGIIFIDIFCKIIYIYPNFNT